MIGWLVIGTIAVILVILMYKSQNLMALFSIIKENFFLIIAILLILFVSFSLYNIHSKYDFDLTSYDGLINTGRVYILWVKGIFNNIGGITGYAVKQDWILNSTNITEAIKK